MALLAIFLYYNKDFEPENTYTKGKCCSQQFSHHAIINHEDAFSSSKPNQLKVEESMRAKDMTELH